MQKKECSSLISKFNCEKWVQRVPSASLSRMHINRRNINTIAKKMASQLRRDSPENFERLHAKKTHAHQANLFFWKNPGLVWEMPTTYSLNNCLASRRAGRNLFLPIHRRFRASGKPSTWLLCERTVECCVNLYCLNHLQCFSYFIIFLINLSSILKVQVFSNLSWNLHPAINHKLTANFQNCLSHKELTFTFWWRLAWTPLGPPQTDSVLCQVLSKLSIRFPSERPVEFD